jgi:hypothetical protein
MWARAAACWQRRGGGGSTSRASCAHQTHDGDIQVAAPKFGVLHLWPVPPVRPAPAGRCPGTVRELVCRSSGDDTWVRLGKL